MTKIEACNLQPGDMVQIRARDVSMEFPAAVVEVSPSRVEIVSTILSVLTGGTRSGKFTQDDILVIVKTGDASDAIPREARRPSFTKGARLSTVGRDDKPCEGSLICALDGVLTIQLDDGRLLTGGANHFSLTT